jgi:hypothetical protein
LKQYFEFGRTKQPPYPISSIKPEMGGSDFKLKNPIRQDSTAISILVLITLCSLVPFLGKPFHVDDPLFVWCARQIAAHPLDFYGFNLNWEGQTAPMAAITQNPPLAAYYLAASGSLFGWSELALHAAFLLPAMAVILGTCFVAKQFCSLPTAAGLFAVSSPVFVLCSTSLMCDTTMLAFWVWAIFFWNRGLESPSHAKFFIASLLIALSSLTKYFGLCLIPLLLAYSVLKKRNHRIWLPWLGLPLVTMALYQWWTQRLYGRGLLLNAAQYATNLRVGGELPVKLLAGLAFSGGCIVIVLFAAPWLWGKRELLLGAGVGLLLGLVLALLKKVGEFPLADNNGINWFYVVQLSLFSVAGLGILAVVVGDLLKHKDADSALLCLWTVGVFLFACAVNWTVSGRNILPMLPAVACLMARRLERGYGASRHPAAWLALPAGLSLLLALVVARADYALAISARDTAKSLYSQFSTSAANVWFEGHWGFQYYMKQLGARPVDRNDLSFSKGDAIVLPINNSFIFPLPPELATRALVREVPTSRWVSTLNADFGAGYYSDGWGPLPFVFGRVPPDVYIVLRAR